MNANGNLAEKQSPEEFEQFEEPLTSDNKVKHSEVLDLILAKVGVVDFKAVTHAKEDEKVKTSHIQIIVIETILKIAKHNKLNICRNNGLIYTFNGQYWKEVDQDTFKTFLGVCAEKMGVYSLTSRHYRFRDELFKQFETSANLPAPEISNKVLINLQNGTLEITDKRVILREHRSEDFLSYQLPFSYDINAAAPIFMKYLNEVLPDENLQRILSEYTGYIFVRGGSLKLEKVLFLYGKGANGKSVYHEIMKNLLGRENVSYYSLQELTDINGYYRAMIADKLLNYSSEITTKLQTDMFKKLASGEEITARLPYGKPMSISNYAKFIFNVNELPRDIEHTEAFFRRFLIIPFSQTIPEEKQDKELHKKIIEAELAGVLNWVLSGLKRLLMQKNFTVSDKSLQALNSFKIEADSVQMFVIDEDYKKDSINYIHLKNLYSDYKSYCSEGGFRPVSVRKFSERLSLQGFEILKRNSGRVVYVSR